MNTRRRLCQTKGCMKTDAGGGYCFKCGGGRSCKSPGCPKSAQRGGFCRAHGGGSKCQVKFCTNVSAGSGKCRRHGGGKRCTVEGCHKADVGQGKCTAHGGGQKCTVKGCDKNSQGGGRCRKHGGGRRCSIEGCDKMARGSIGKCSQHGGIPLCKAKSCRRLARGRNGYCVAHEEEDSSEPMKSTVPATTENADTLGISSDKQISFSSTGYPFIHETIESGVKLVDFELPTEVKCATASTDNCITSGCNASYGGVCKCVSCSCCQSKSDAVLQNQSPPPSVTLSSEVSYRRVVFQVHSSQNFAVLEYLDMIRDKLNACETFDSIDYDPTSHHLLFIGLVSSHDVGVALKKCENIVGPCSILQESTLTCPRKEIVLYVPEIMCMASCGNTVRSALENVWGVENVLVTFENRQVVVLGTIQINWISKALNAIGFPSTVISILNVPNKLWLNVRDECAQLNLHTAAPLRQLLLQSNLVESAVWFSDKSMMLIEAFLDAELLISIIRGYGYIVNEAKPVQGSPTSVDYTPVHVCSIDPCAANGCPQYQATMAHTAALAVGWVVSGCSMSWGGECTCGDNCKCKGCPTHDPDNSDKLEKN